MHVSMAGNRRHQKPHSTSKTGLQEADKEKSKHASGKPCGGAGRVPAAARGWFVPGRIACTAAQHLRLVAGLLVEIDEE